MGHDEPHEPDDPCGCHPRRGQQRSHYVGHLLDALHVRPEIACRLLTDCHEVERAGETRQQNRGRHGIQRHRRNGGPICAGEAAHHPQDGAPHRTGVGDGQDERDTGSEKRAHHDPGQKEHSHVDSVIGGSRDPHHENDGQEGSYERRGRESPGVTRYQAERQGQDGSGGGSAGDPQDVWLRQGVAEQCLKNRSGQGQSSAHQDSQRRPRRP